MFVQSPTYFLAPNFDFKPGGKIALGNIIVNPLKPHIAILRSSPETTPPVDVSISTDWTFSTQSGPNVTLGVFATFLEVIKTPVNIGRERSFNNKYSAETLHTVNLRDDPTHEEVLKLCENAKIREFMNPRSVLCKPVYMVTGLKIAKGFKLQAEENLTYTAGEEVGGDIVAGMVGAGVNTSVEKSNAWGSGFSAEDDIVFAYQLLKIKPKGWFKGREPVAREFTDGALLGDDDGAGEDEDVVIEAEKDLVTEWDLREMDGVEARQVVDAWVAVPKTKRDSGVFSN